MRENEENIIKASSERIKKLEETLIEVAKLRGDLSKTASIQLNN